jgi:outer membrane protein TolC
MANPISKLCAFPYLRSRQRTAVIFVSLLLSSSSASAQSASSVSGSVPNGPASTEVMKLSLRDAVALAIRFNLGQIESQENVRALRGQRLQSLSSLLPHLSAGVSENAAETTTAPLGIRSPVIPRVIAPFSYSTAQVSATQSILSVESIQRYRAIRTAEQAAALSYQDTLDVVTVAVANSYIQVIEAASRIEAAEAQVRNAQAIYDQALEDLHAGTSPKIDVTRSSVQLHTEQYNLSVARNGFAIAKLSLGRAIGLPLGQRFELAESLPYADIEPPSIEDALKEAYRSRQDFGAALTSIQTAQKELSAARGERFPVLAIAGDYGLQGPTFGRSHAVFDFQAGVRVPILTGGRIKGEVATAEATLRRRKAEAENLRGQIDYDVRSSYLNLEAAKEEVTVAKQNVDLANENLERSRERFSAGVTDSVEVVQAQQALASANDQYIAGLYAHNLAKLQLARSLGVARSSYGHYLSSK